MNDKLEKLKTQTQEELAVIKVRNTMTVVLIEQSVFLHTVRYAYIRMISEQDAGVSAVQSHLQQGWIDSDVC